MAGSAASKTAGRAGEWAGEVIPTEELTALLARFGMIVGLDTSPEADHELQAAQLAHALVGAAHTSTNIQRAPGEAATAGQALAKAMGALSAASTLTCPDTNSTAAFGTSSRRGNRASCSKNFNIRANPSRVGPVLLASSLGSASSSVQHSMRSSSSHSRRIAGPFSCARTQRSGETTGPDHPASCTPTNPQLPCG